MSNQEVEKNRPFSKPAQCTVKIFKMLLCRCGVHVASFSKQHILYLLVVVEISSGEKSIIGQINNFSITTARMGQ